MRCGTSSAQADMEREAATTTDLVDHPDLGNCPPSVAKSSTDDGRGIASPKPSVKTWKRMKNSKVGRSF